MIVIADSGSTKTDWCLGNTKTNSRTVRTGGINPFHQSVDEIKEVIASTLIPQLGDTTEFTTIYFYGAGCIPEKTNIVKTALAQNFPKANILVESDLLGAAHALCGKTAGIACILGTGSNSCFYDGKKITANISPLGYILGDEGSGAVLGKRLVGDLLKHQLPDDLCQDFLKEYDLTPALILDKVYRQPLANRFLAGLTPFLFAHKHRPEIRNLLISCFTDFFTRNVMQYEYHDILVHFTGSIAFFFQEEVKEAIDALHGNGPEDLMTVCYTLAAHMISLGKNISCEAAVKEAKESVESGRAFDTFVKMVEMQGGDTSYILFPETFPVSPVQAELKAPNSGYLTYINTEGVGTAAGILGAGRNKKEDDIDPCAGIILHKKLGQKVGIGESIATLYTSDKSLLDAGIRHLETCYEIKDVPESVPELIQECIS